jgi:hypothetical protein
VAVIIFFGYHKGKIKTKARFLGMKPAGAAAVLTEAMVIIVFIRRKKKSRHCLLFYSIIF